MAERKDALVVSSGRQSMLELTSGDYPAASYVSTCAAGSTGKAVIEKTTSAPLSRDYEAAVKEVAALVSQIDQIARQLPGMARLFKNSALRNAADRVMNRSQALNLAIILQRGESELSDDLRRLYDAIMHLSLLMEKSRHSLQFGYAVRVTRSFCMRLLQRCRQLAL